jgi:cellulose synthase/poly-beta-1,6-N-acetylglucosamine synthase-like glycosyltransferase
MNISIVVIFDKLRKDKLDRLLNSMKDQLSNYSLEILFLHESNTPLIKPDFPVEVTYLNIPAKQGIAFNRNQGIKHAQGDIIVFIDDDCWVPEGWLSSLLLPLQNNPDILATTSGTKIPPSNFLGDCISELGFPGGGSLGFEKVWKVSTQGFTDHLTVGNCALRKSVFTTIGLFDETMKSGAEDAEFSLRLTKANISLKYIPQAYAYHEARTTMSDFVKWQLRRGRANYQFKKRVGPIGGFVKLRLWSSRNIVAQNLLKPRLPVVVGLLGLSFLLQQAGFMQERRDDLGGKS